MRSRSAVRTFKPAVESLESRDVPSALLKHARRLLPVAQQITANANAALATLQADDSIRTSILTAVSHPTPNSAAATYGQAAAALQEVLTERRVLEIVFLQEFNLFKAVNTEDPVTQAHDKAVFKKSILPAVNALRSQVSADENAALGLGIVNSGISTFDTPGFVTVTTGLNAPVNIDITYPPLRPSLAAGIVTVPVYDFSSAVWAFLPVGYVPPSNNP